MKIFINLSNGFLCGDNMPAKKKTSKEPSWDKIGDMIGQKIGGEFNGKSCCSPWDKGWKDHLTVKLQESGGFGRLIFAIGMLLALNRMDIWVGMPWWLTGLVIVGFWWMRL